MDKTGDNFLTDSYFSTGVFISNRGTGTTDYMTADDGWTFTPPEQFTFTLTGLKADSEVRIYNAADEREERELVKTELFVTNYDIAEMLASKSNDIFAMDDIEIDEDTIEIPGHIGLHRVKT